MELNMVIDMCKEEAGDSPSCVAVISKFDNIEVCKDNTEDEKAYKKPRDRND